MGITSGILPFHFNSVEMNKINMMKVVTVNFIKTLLTSILLCSIPRKKSLAIVIKSAL